MTDLSPEEQKAEHDAFKANPDNRGFRGGWIAARTYYAEQSRTTQSEPQDICVVCGSTEELPSGDCAQCAERRKAMESLSIYKGSTNAYERQLIEIAWRNGYNYAVGRLEEAG